MTIIDAFSIHLDKSSPESVSEMTVTDCFSPKDSIWPQVYLVFCSGQFVGFIQAID